MSRTRKFKILLLGTDETFARGIEHSVAFRAMEVDWHSSLLELGSIGRLGLYDAVIVEHDLRPVNGFRDPAWTGRESASKRP